MPVGVVQYHLRLLTGSDLITYRREKRYKRYFKQGKFSADKMKVISTLRKETARRILSALLDEPQKPHGELAVELGISSQALTWQMNRLKLIGLVKVEKHCRNVSYSLCCDYLSTVEECLEII
ncbi:MAG: winged helix-turn-helix transcriptional regulator [Candidatus Bathyarchaeota archaeon]|jgi:predicted transcriptional regulator